MSIASDFFASPMQEGFLIGMRRFFASGTLVVPCDCIVDMVAIGGGAGGALAFDSGGAQCLVAAGGGAGGFVRALRRVSAGTSLSVTVGAGGASRSAVSNAFLTGNAGTATTITGTGISISAGGGSGGGATIGDSTTLIVAGGAGGIATGGDINMNGGSGGSIEAIVSSFSSAAGVATGGGGVRLLGLNSDGGSYFGGISDGQFYAMGGGGVGSEGADGVGGGAGLGRYNIFGVNDSDFDPSAVLTLDSMSTFGFYFFGNGASGSTLSATAGGGGSYDPYDVGGMDAGMFGGGSGAFNIAPLAGAGGGGGGCCFQTEIPSDSGAGGNGMAVVALIMII